MSVLQMSHDEYLRSRIRWQHRCQARSGSRQRQTGSRLGLPSLKQAYGVIRLSASFSCLSELGEKRGRAAWRALVGERTEILTERVTEARQSVARRWSRANCVANCGRIALAFCVGKARCATSAVWLTRLGQRGSGDAVLRSQRIS